MACRLYSKIHSMTAAEMLSCTIRVRRGRYVCWEYPGRRQSRKFWMRLHRIKSLPRDVHICHWCDNGHCIRPSHMYRGTAHSNMQDQVRHGTCGGYKNRGRKFGPYSEQRRARMRLGARRGDAHWTRSNEGKAKLRVIVPRGDKHWTRSKHGRMMMRQFSALGALARYGL